MFGFIATLFLATASMSTSVAQDRVEIVEKDVNDVRRHVNNLRGRLWRLERRLDTPAPAPTEPERVVITPTPTNGLQEQIDDILERLDEIDTWIDTLKCSDLPDEADFVCEGELQIVQDDLQDIEVSIRGLKADIRRLEDRRNGTSVKTDVCLGLDLIPGNELSPCVMPGLAYWTESGRQRFSIHAGGLFGNPLSAGIDAFARWHFRDRGGSFAWGLDLGMRVRDYNLEPGLNFHEFRAVDFVRGGLSFAWTVSDADHMWVDITGHVKPSAGVLIKTPAVGGGAPSNWFDGSIGLGFEIRFAPRDRDTADYIVDADDADASSGYSGL